LTTKKTNTLIGTVVPAPAVTSQIATGWNLIGDPYPSALGFVGASSLKDQIWTWDNKDKKFVATRTYNGPEKGWLPPLQLSPGRGYWYNHLGEGFAWQTNKK
jgi:hypothetical protein